MATLGIEENELLIKYLPFRSLDDFAGPHISSDIQNLRYTYHRKKLAETVKKLKYQIREDRQRQGNASSQISAKPPKSPMSAKKPELEKSKSLADFLLYEQSKLTQAKEKYKKKIVNMLERSLPSPVNKKTPPEIPEGELTRKDQLLKEQLDKKHEEIEQRRQRHAEKLQEIQKNKETLQREMFRNISKSMREHEERGRKLEMEKRELLNARAKSMQEKQMNVQRKMSEKETEIDRKLQEKLMEIEEKIKKNRQLHLEAVKERAEKATKSLVKAELKSNKLESLKAENELERIKQYISAQQQAQSRKHEITSSQLEKFEESRKKVEEKMGHIRELQLKEKQEESKQINRLEKKMQTASQVLAQRQRDWSKELELRLEMQRLMDEDKRTKVERAQRRFVGIM